MQDLGAHIRWFGGRIGAVDRRPAGAGAGPALLWNEGDVPISLRDGDIAVRPGDVAIADRSVLDTICGAADWRVRVLYLSDRRIVEQAVGAGKPVALVLDGATKLAGMLKQVWAIGDDMARLQLHDEAIDATLIDLVTGLGARLVVEATDGRLPIHAAATVERARATIRAHLADPAFGVAALARMMRISPRRLSALFAPLGLTTAGAILEMRVERGKTLLREPVNTRRQLSDIALACGFEDQSYFSRCFRRLVGRTPRQFRADHQISDFPE